MINANAASQNTLVLGICKLHQRKLAYDYAQKKNEMANFLSLIVNSWINSEMRRKQNKNVNVDLNVVNFVCCRENASK